MGSTFRLSVVASVVAWPAVRTRSVAAWANHQEAAKFRLGADSEPDVPPIELLTLLVVAAVAMAITITASLAGPRLLSDQWVSEQLDGHS